MGGSPANSAYAIPCGTSRAVSTRPATRSFGSQRRSYVRIRSRPGTRVVTHSRLTPSPACSALSRPHQQRTIRKAVRHFLLARPVERVHVWAARTALLVAGIGLALFASAALLVHGGAPAWDTQAFRALNAVSPGLAAWLTPITKLFLPAGIAVAAGAPRPLHLFFGGRPWPVPV